MAGLSRQRFPRTLGRASRRKTSWALGPKSGIGGGVGSNLTASSVVLGAVGAAAALDGITVIRIRGELMLRLNTASSQGNGFHGAVGVGLARNPAFTAGIASLPTPITEEFQDNWLWHQYFACLANGAITAAGVSLSGGQSDGTTAALRVQVDSKAMRKLNIGDTIYVAIEATEVGTAQLAWSFNSRMLVKQQ